MYAGYGSSLGPPTGGPPGKGPGKPGEGEPPRHPDGPPKKGPHGPPGDGGHGPQPGSPAMSSNETFLRGGWPTDANGLVELTVIYPGWYAGRTTHIHTSAHVNWEKAENG